MSSRPYPWKFFSRLIERLRKTFVNCSIFEITYLQNKSLIIGNTSRSTVVVQEELEKRV